jgi:PAS domain-containing protein
MADNGTAPAKSLLDALAESAADAIITIDAGRTILSANQAVRRIFGYGPSEPIAWHETHKETRTPASKAAGVPHFRSGVAQ